MPPTDYLWNALRTLTAYDGSGTAAEPDASTGYVTLGVDTYYFPVDIGQADLGSIQIVTDDTIVATFTLWSSNFPRDASDGVGPASYYTEEAGDVGKWVQENPPAAYIATTGTGWSVLAATLTKTAGLGGAMIQLDDVSAHRLVIKAVVATGGTCRLILREK